MHGLARAQQHPWSAVGGVDASAGAHALPLDLALTEVHALLLYPTKLLAVNMVNRQAAQVCASASLTVCADEWTWSCEWTDVDVLVCCCMETAARLTVHMFARNMHSPRHHDPSTWPHSSCIIINPASIHPVSRRCTLALAAESPPPHQGCQPPLPLRCWGSVCWASRPTQRLGPSTCTQARGTRTVVWQPLLYCIVLLYTTQYRKPSNKGWYLFPSPLVLLRVRVSRVCVQHSWQQGPMTKS